MHEGDGTRDLGRRAVALRRHDALEGLEARPFGEAEVVHERRVHTAGCDPIDPHVAFEVLTASALVSMAAPPLEAQ